MDSRSQENWNPDLVLLSLSKISSGSETDFLAESKGRREEKKRGKRMRNERKQCFYIYSLVLEGEIGQTVIREAVFCFYFFL